MKREQLNIVLKKHKMWLSDEENGKKADLSGADLSCDDLQSTDLRSANLNGADYEFYLSVSSDLVIKNKDGVFVISWLEFIKFLDEKERN